MITKIEAKGPVVVITSDLRGDEIISRKEALLRIDALLGMDKTDRMADMLEALINACNQARINELGMGYNPASLENLRAKIRKGQQEAKLRDKDVILPDFAPAGVTRTVYHDDGSTTTIVGDMETPAPEKNANTSEQGGTRSMTSDGSVEDSDSSE